MEIVPKVGKGGYQIRQTAVMKSDDSHCNGKDWLPFPRISTKSRLSTGGGYTMPCLRMSWVGYNSDFSGNGGMTEVIIGVK